MPANRHAPAVAYDGIKVIAAPCVSQPCTARRARFSAPFQDDSFRPFSVGGAALRDLRHVIKLVARTGAPEYGAPIALDRVKLAAPVGPLAKNVICVGKNYHDHAQEFARSGVDLSGDKQEVPADPVIFTKSTVIARRSVPENLRRRSDPTHTVDYEGEFGVVIGKRCKNVKRADALDYVFGYTIVNDVTAPRRAAAPQAMVSRQKPGRLLPGRTLAGDAR